MSDGASTFALQYERALQSFLLGPGEEGLRQGYELGRQAVQDGVGCLELLRIHDRALLTFVGQSGSPAEITSVMAVASQFFSESLSPFEMTTRGFQEAVQALKVRAKELSDINIRLEQEAAERIVAGEALKISEGKYRSLVETARDVIYTLATDGRITSLNPAFEEVLGWLRDEWMHKSWAPLVHPNDLPLAVETFHAVLRGEQPDVVELRVLTRSGQYVVGEFVKTPLLRDGLVVGVLGIARDVTARKTAEARLRRNERQLAVAQQIALVGSWEWNSGTSEFLCSAELYRILGIEAESFERRMDAYLERVHPADRDVVSQAFDEVLRTKRPLRLEHRIVRPDGSIRTLETRVEIVPEVDDESLPRIMGTGQDITERKQANEALRTMAQRIVAAQEEERKRIARELHDDVCQRLSAAKFQMEALHDRVPDKRSGVARGIGRLKRQVGSSIREIRRLSADLRPPALDDLGLKQAINVLCRDFEKSYRIPVEFSSGDFEDEVLSHHAQSALYRIAQEALANIAKHANARRVVVDIRPASSSILLTVRDNGKGFALTTTKPRADNTGFGLVSMRERATLIGASFDVQSAPRRGTTIRLEIPTKKEQTREAHQNTSG